MSQKVKMDDKLSTMGKMYKKSLLSAVRWNDSTAMFFWKDGTQSEYNFLQNKFYTGRFGFNEEGLRNNIPNHRDKQLITIIANPEGKLYAFWNDETYCEWGNNPTYNYKYNDDFVGWPSGKKLVTAYNDINTDDGCFFWNDGTFSIFNWQNMKFDGNVADQKYLFGDQPKRKLISSTINNVYPSQVFLFWDDHTTSIFFSSIDGGLTDPGLEFTGWPVERRVGFDSVFQELENIRINVNGTYQIIHIGDKWHTQVPITVWVKVRDKNTHEYVKITDRDVNDSPLIMFYDYQLGPEANRQSYLDLDGVGGLSFSRDWKISRLPFSDKKIMSASGDAIVSSGEDVISSTESALLTSTVEATAAAETESYFDGWNRFTYYVTTTKPTTIKQLAARVGVEGAYQYTGSDGLDEYKSFKAIHI